MQKKLFAVTLAVAVLALAAPAYAKEEGSKAIAEHEIEVGVSNFNFGCVTNMVMTGANTGMNETMSMQGVNLSRRHHYHQPTPAPVESNTGAAGAMSTVDSDLNSSTTVVKVHDFQNGPVAANMAEEEHHHDRRGRGDDGKSFAKAEDEIDIEVSNFNMGGVTNMVLTGANSGMNQTMGGKSETGDAAALAEVSTDLNSNDTTVEVKTAGSGVLAMNQGRGVAIAEEETEVEVMSFNSGYVMNMLGTAANTGANHTSDGQSNTGAALAVAGVVSNVNSNTTSVMVDDNSNGPVAANVAADHRHHEHEAGCTSDECGSPEPQEDCLPSVCGEKLDGPAAVNTGSGVAVVEDETEVTVANVNVGEVINMVGTVANSGDNGTTSAPVASDCHHDTQTAPTTSSTGDAAAASDVTNTVNTNTTNVVVVTN